MVHLSIVQYIYYENVPLKYNLRDTKRSLFYLNLTWIQNAYKYNFKIQKPDVKISFLFFLLDTVRALMCGHICWCSLTFHGWNLVIYRNLVHRPTESNGQWMTWKCSLKYISNVTTPLNKQTKLNLQNQVNGKTFNTRAQ